MQATNFKHAAILIVLLIFALTGCIRPTVEPGSSLNEFTSSMEEHIPLLLEKYGVPGASIALVLRGKPVWVGAFGYADTENQRTMTLDALCRGESISKSVTAWGVLRLAEQGFINLDEPVTDYLPDWDPPEGPYSWEGVTIHRLLSGSAGLPLGTVGPPTEYTPGSPMPTLHQFLAEEISLIREPGSAFEYSNPGFNLLELMLEEVTGRDFAEYMAAEVLRPLGMTEADFAWQDFFSTRVPVGYETDGTAVPPYVYPARASGGLFSGVEDLARFVCAGMTAYNNTGRAVLSPEGIEGIYTPHVEITGLFGQVADYYGYGHFIEELPDGRKAVWHGGQGHGWMTHFHALPESGDGIVILTNSQRSWPFLAEVLTDWSLWRGFGPVKFGKITLAGRVFRFITALLFLVPLLLAYRIIRGVRRGFIIFSPTNGWSSPWRISAAAAGALGIIALLIAVSRPYLFITSIFPGTADLAGLACFLVAIMMIVSSLFYRETRVQ